jgi:RNA polymerase sigma factor (sigma-70 family)
MPARQLTPVLRYLAKLSGTVEAASLSDAQLLDRFARRGDETAFATLVRRHGPMVFAVCRRLLRDVNDAEDAFQATFLLLLRKAGSLRRPELVGSWLHGVAVRTALKARAIAGKRHRRERPVVEQPAIDADDYLWRDLRPILDEAIRQLPQKYRVPFVLCHLQGMTNAQAADRLGCPLGTVAIRLSRARQRLRVRLTKHGVALTAGALAVALEKHLAAAATPLGLVQSVGRLPSILGTSTAIWAGAVSCQVAALTEGVSKAMFMEKVKAFGLAVALLAGTVGTGTGMLVLQARAAQAPAAPATSRPSTAVIQQPVEDPTTTAPPVRSTLSQQSGSASDRSLSPSVIRPNQLLPKGPAPYTAYAVLDGEGRIVLRIPSGSVYYQPNTTWSQRPDGGKTATTSYELISREHVMLVDTKHVQAYGVDGKRIETKSVEERLKKEIPVLVSANGQPVDPFHLQLIKEGTLVLVLFERDGVPRLPVLPNVDRVAVPPSYPTPQYAPPTSVRPPQPTAQPLPEVPPATVPDTTPRPLPK